MLYEIRELTHVPNDFLYYCISGNILSRHLCYNKKKQSIFWVQTSDYLLSDHTRPQEIFIKYILTFALVLSFSSCVSACYVFSFSHFPKSASCISIAFSMLQSGLILSLRYCLECSSQVLWFPPSSQNTWKVNWLYSGKLPLEVTMCVNMCVN